MEEDRSEQPSEVEDNRETNTEEGEIEGEVGEVDDEFTFLGLHEVIQRIVFMRQFYPNETEEETMRREMPILRNVLRRRERESEETETDYRNQQEERMKKFLEETKRTDLIGMYDLEYIRDENTGRVKFIHRRSSRMGVLKLDQSSYVSEHRTGNMSPRFRDGVDFYYEVFVESLDDCGDNGSRMCLGVGLCKRDFKRSFVGWRFGSCGYHADNGVIYDNFETWKTQENKEQYLMGTYKTGDTIGVGYNLESGVIFFTKNGYRLPYETKRDFGQDMFFPCVTSMCRTEEENVVFTVNCGEDTLKKPFLNRLYNVMLDCRSVKKFFDVMVVTQY